MTDLPPARPDRVRRRWLLPALILIVIAVAVGGWYWWGAGSSKETPTEKAKGGAKGSGKGGGKGGRFSGGSGGPQPVTAVAARTGDINVVQTSIGTATALRTATVRPRVDGLLQTVLFTEGQQVAAGAPLAQIDPAPFQVALSQAEGQLARDAAQLNNARLDLERYRTLLAQDSIAGQQVDQQAAMVRQLEGTVKLDQAQVDNAKLNLSWTRITAPIPGRLGLRLVDPGNMVRQSDANGIAVITQVDPITVVYTIPQDILPRVNANLAGNQKIGVEAWDRDQKVLLAKGELITADNQIDVTTGTVKLKAQFPNPKAALFPNQFVNVRMVIETRRNVVVVPTAAVQRNAQGANVVYVVKSDSTVTIRPVTVGPTEGTNTAIEKGLEAGETVVTDGVDRIREGAKVEVTQPGGGARGEGREGGKGGDYKKRLEGMTPEQREEAKKRFESMTPEQREEFKKRREAQGKGAPQ
jgi:multidrug efflux system membrane fusion protein